MRWVLVDEICGDGEGTDDLQSLAAPMFRDGAAIADHLFAVDASHLWSLDLAKPTGQIARSALLTGLGQPLAVAQRGSELVLAAPVRSRSLSLPGAAFDVQVVGDHVRRDGQRRARGDRPRERRAHAGRPRART